LLYFTEWVACPAELREGEMLTISLS